MKRPWQIRINVQKGCSALHSNNSFIRNWLIVFKLDYSRKKMGLRKYFFEKTLEFLVSSFHPWKFWTKQSFIPGNSGRFYGTSWPKTIKTKNWEKSETKNHQDYYKFFMIFSWFPLKIWLIFYLTPGNSTYQYSWKIHVLE